MDFLLFGNARELYDHRAELCREEAVYCVFELPVVIGFKFPQYPFVQLLFRQSWLQVDMERQFVIFQPFPTILLALRMTGPVTP